MINILLLKIVIIAGVQGSLALQAQYTFSAYSKYDFSYATKSFSRPWQKQSSLLSYPSKNTPSVFAGVQGLEPRLTGPKPGVLPLDDTPIFIWLHNTKIPQKINMVIHYMYEYEQ